MLRVGNHPPTTPMPVLVVTGLAVLRWMFGKQTQSPQPTPRTHVIHLAKPCAMVKLVVELILVHVTREPVIPMDVTSTHGAWATKPFMEKV